MMRAGVRGKTASVFKGPKFSHRSTLSVPGQRPALLNATSYSTASAQLHCLTAQRAFNVGVMKRNKETAPAFLGLDCGGTRSVAVYECGDIRRRAEAGPGNIRLLSDDQLRALFQELSSVHKNLPPPTAIAIGMAGAGLERERERLRQAAAHVWPNIPCAALNDLDTALAAAEIDGPADGKNFSALVVVLSGTGSCFFGRNARGRRVRVGGWGHIVGDKGSAYEIGLRALKAVLYYHDRDGKMPPLGRRLLRALLLNEPGEIPPWALTASKTDIAALAREVSTAASRGDKTARDILEGAAHTLAKDALTCAARLAARSKRVKFFLSGSVLLNQPAFARRVAKYIREARPAAIVVNALHESALGALVLAKERAASLELAVGATRELPVPNRQHAGSKFSGPQRGFSRAVSPSTLNPQPSTPPRHWTSNLGLTSSPTEQRHPRSMNLDRLPLSEAIALMLSEDGKIPAALLAERPKIERVIRLIVRSFQSGGRLIYVGAGTSGRLGVLDASECPPTFRSDPEMVQGIIAGGPTALWRAAEGAEDDPAAGARAIESRGINRRDTVVGIAASGRTPFVWGALDEAKRRGAATVMVTLNPQLKIPRAHRPTVLLAPDIGPEILTGSTRLKSGTATKLILNLFTTLAMVRMGKVVSNLMVDVKPTNVKLRARAVGIVRTLTGADEAEAQAALLKTGWVIQDAVVRIKMRTPVNKRAVE